MQTFQDAATQKIWQFEQTVVVTEKSGVYAFAGASGAPLAVPTTLQPYSGPVPPVAAPTAAQLRAYANAKAASLLAVMRSYAGSGVTLKSDATSETLGDLARIERWAISNPTSSQNWSDNDGGVTAVTGAQFSALAPQIEAYRTVIYSTDLAAVLAEIAAGTIATAAQIDGYPWTV